MADLKAPLCAVTLLYKNGYFKQKIEDNYQKELDDVWDYKNILTNTNKKVKVNISGKDVIINIWKHERVGVNGHIVPIFFLDTNLEENEPWARELTDNLYVGDRLSQEIVLGVGGARALKELDIHPEKYHMNEGHSSFLTLELYKTLGEKNGWDDGQVKEKCVFTTHTPIAAGHDKFSYEEIYEKFKGETNMIPLHIKKLAGEDELNTTRLAMSFSYFINAVSRKHGEVTKTMFPEFTINYITNGIHTASWVSDQLSKVYDRYLPGWRQDYSLLKGILNTKFQIFIVHI